MSKSAVQTGASQGSRTLLSFTQRRKVAFEFAGPLTTKPARVEPAPADMAGLAFNRPAPCPAAC